ncbi:MAG: HAD hydrolase-like protein [Alphaproteobacteria bacterium]|nr:HAD hydrolase-like protein [Alphaproteobacteria bacterium]
MFRHQGAWHWDIDGCAVDNEATHVQSWIDAAATYGVTLTDAMFDQMHTIFVLQENGSLVKVHQYLRGSDPSVIACWILGQQNPGIAAGKVGVNEMKQDIAAITDLHLSGFLKNKDLLRAREGVEGVIENLHSHNWIIGAVTGSKRPIFEANMFVLKKARRLWDYVITAEEVSLEHKKPSPYPYLLGLVKTAQLMGFNEPTKGVLDCMRHRSGACEDGKSGVISAVLADIPCVQFLPPGQALFTEEIPNHPLSQWVFPATSRTQLKGQINRVAETFSPPAPLI